MVNKNFYGYRSALINHLKKCIIKEFLNKELLKACKKQDFCLVGVLVESNYIDLNNKNPLGLTPLTMALNNGIANPGVIALLVAKEANVEIIDPNGLTSLEIAHQRKLDNVIPLLESGNETLLRTAIFDSYVKFLTSFCSSENKPILSIKLLHWFRDECNADDAQSSYAIGLIYHKKLNAIENAKIWYQRAADKGHQEAQQKLDSLNNALCLIS